MGIFDFLKTQNSPQRKEVPQEPKDERKAECPSCDAILKKVPGAKTKCPQCGEFMYVRTRPDNVRIVLTGKQVAEIEQMELFLKFAGDQCGITPDEILLQRDKGIDMVNALGWNRG